MIRIVIADDQELVRTGFGLILDSQPDMSVVASVGNGDDALKAIREQGPDIALLDIRMPGLSGLEVCEKTAGKTNVIIVTTFGLDEYVDRALEVGARGFLLKDAGPALLLESIRAAVRGETLISPALVEALLQRRQMVSAPDEPEADCELSAREEEIARLVAKGRTNAEIASDLFIAPSTVKTHLANIQSRLNARNRVEIAAYMWKHGLVHQKD